MKRSHSMPSVPIRPAAELIQALATLGYLVGPPAHITPDSKAIDRQLCRALVCPGCRKRGMDYRPLHRGRQYAAVAACSHCGAGEDL